MFKKAGGEGDGKEPGSAKGRAKFVGAGPPPAKKKGYAADDPSMTAQERSIQQQISDLNRQLQQERMKRAKEQKKQQHLRRSRLISARPGTLSRGRLN